MSYQNREFTAGPDDAGKRIDRVLRTLFPGLSLSWAYRALRKGDIRLNGKKTAFEVRIRAGDRITARLSPEDAASIGATDQGPVATQKATESSDLLSLPPFKDLILLENEDILIINKPRGMPSHGIGGADIAARAYLAGKLPESLAFQPGPLHRLDRNSSGILCLSKSIRGARTGSAAFHDRKVRKYYLAVVEGEIATAQGWSDRLARIETEQRTVAGDQGGKLALTSVFPVARKAGASLCLFKIETGRTHQIRAQASLHGHPLRGDRKYGSGERSAPYILHCIALVFSGADRGPFPASIEAGPGDEESRAIGALFGQGAIAELQAALRRIMECGSD